MHSRITPTLFFILANFTFGDFTPAIIVQSNGNLTLQPKVEGLPEDILWRWNGNKVVEFDQKEVQDYGKFKGRTILDLTTGDLTLTHLTESDSGEYVCELLIKGQIEYYSRNVKVFDAVGKPAVTCQVNSTSVTLLCSGDNRTTTEYRWEGPAIELQPGPRLEIEAAESSDSVYTCVLQNPVSQSRTDFPVKSCFPAPETSVNTPLLITLLLLIFIIIVGLLLFYYKKCYKKRQDEEVVEFQPVGRRLKEEDSGVNKSLNVAVKSEERVHTEGRNSPEHLSPGTVLLSAPMTPSAAPPKTGSEDNTNHPPESSLCSPQHPKSPPHSAQGPIHSQDQEEETESSDETGALVEISEAEVNIPRKTSGTP